jgi:hypothetical protein
MFYGTSEDRGDDDATKTKICSESCDDSKVCYTRSPSATRATASCSWRMPLVIGVEVNKKEKSRSSICMASCTHTPPPASGTATATATCPDGEMVVCRIHAVTGLPDSRICSGTCSGVLHMFEEGGGVLCKAAAHTGAVTATVALASAKDSLLLSTGKDCTGKIWRVEDNRMKAVLRCLQLSVTLGFCAGK